MFLLATSNGAKGAVLVLEIAYNRISRGNPNDIQKFSLPNFKTNFDSNSGIKNDVLNNEFLNKLYLFKNSIID